MASIIKAMPRRCIGDHRNVGRDQPGAVVRSRVPEQDVQTFGEVY